MGVDVEVRPEQRADVGQQVGAHLLRLLEAHGGEGVLLVQALAAGDLLHPFLVELPLPQFLGDLDGGAPGAEEGRLALQPGYRKSTRLKPSHSCTYHMTSSS